MVSQTRSAARKGLKNSAKGVETPVKDGESLLSSSISSVVVHRDGDDPVPKGAQAQAVSRSQTEGRPSYRDVVAAPVCVPELSDLSDAGSTASTMHAVVQSHVVNHAPSGNNNLPAPPGTVKSPGRARNKDVIDNEGWITPRKTQSLEDLHHKKVNSNLRFQVPRDHLSAEQTEAVRLAEASLTPSQRNAIRMRHEMVNENSETRSSEDLGSDPETGRIPAELKRKGKAVEGDEPDNLSDIDIDMAAQVTAYEKFYNERRGTGPSKNNAPVGNLHDEEIVPENGRGFKNPTPKSQRGVKRNRARDDEMSSESPSDADDESDDVPSIKNRKSTSSKSKDKKIHYEPMTPYFEKKLRDVVHGKSTREKSK